MPRIALVSGTALFTVGLVAYFLSGQASLTALIPVPFGVALAASGWIAQRSGSTKHPMHVAAGVALLGFLGSADGLLGLAKMLAGDVVERPLADVTKGLMAAILAVFLVLCIRSFLNARRASD